MGALMLATKEEVEDLVRRDPAWWSMVLGKVSERGMPALREEAALRSWSWGAVWGWVVGDADRYGELQGALEACANLMGWETKEIADGATPEDVAVAKLRVDTNFRLAGKVDRGRWGEKVDYIGVALDPLSEMLKEISERKMAQLREAPALKEPRVIEASHEIVAEQPLAEEGEV